MNCWHCERPAHGVCVFYGRAVCRDHIKTMPFLLSIYRHNDTKLRAIAVDDTLHCGVCRPRETPLLMEELDGD
ncbi:MAG: hypothetical protein RDV48_26135 [Candidatus Eremiobacteraeota bacterium]|nr:hypothetical protein [Candidatus Eremiobacteraeota bacterium]